MKSKAFALLLALAAATSTRAYDFKSGDLHYNITSNTEPYTVEVTKDGWDNYSSLTSVTIPETVTYNGTDYAVTSIGEWAFYDCTGLTSVTIPNSVTSIGKYAFYDCTGLTSVTIPNSVTSIGEESFYGCTGLTSVVWNANCSGWSYSSSSPFYYARENITSFTFGDEVESIPDYLCYDMSKLTSITIPNSVTSIGEKSFYGCTGLESVTIGNSVTSIGEESFYGCTGLTSVVWNANCSGWSYSSSSPFYYARENITSFTFGDEVESIPDYLCYDMSKLTSITIPNSVTSIGEKSFYGCTGLESVTIGNSVTSIGEESFYGCTGLTSVVWNANCSGWSYSSSSPFYYARENITSFTFGDEVESIPDYLCYDMSKLTSITIPNSVTSIGESAFWGCTGLNSITIPASVKYIGERAFGRPSTGSRSVYYTGDVAGWCSMELADQYSNPLYYNTWDYEAELYINGILVTGTLNIPNGVTSINKYVTFGSVEILAIPESVTSISSSCAMAFYLKSFIVDASNPNYSSADGVLYNKKQTKIIAVPKSISGFVTIPNSISSLDGEFSGRWALNSVQLPEELDYIGSETFMNCTYLSEVGMPKSVRWIGRNAFSGCTNLSSITIPESVMSIGPWAFQNCESLTSITIPNGVTSIEQATFEGCTSLESVTIGSNITGVEELAFYGCKNLKSAIALPNVQSVGVKAFADCAGIPSVSFGTAIEQIGDSAFAGCSRIINVLTIPEKVASIGENAFEGTGITEVVWRARAYPDCTQGATPFHKEGSFDLRGQIKSFAFGESVQSVPAYLCAGMSAVRSMQLPNGVQSVGFGAFAGCTGVSLLSLGTGIEHIADSAFAGCSRVNAVTLPTGLSDIGNYAFEGTGLVDVTSYATLPPLAESTTFPQYNATLSVPCDVLQNYRRDVIFGNFASIKCIGAAEVETTDEVTVEPSANDAVFTWPSEAQASTYTLEIRKDGEVFCTLIFNGLGQLTGIAFAPSPDGTAPVGRAAAATGSGYRFTVTGLDEASAYTYDLTVKNADDKVLRNYTGAFVTDGATALHGADITSLYAENGRIVCEQDFRIYDLLGRDVTRMNGSLNGVYIVKVGEKAQKVVVSSK